MIQASNRITTDLAEMEQRESQKSNSKFDMFASGIAMGVVVTTIVETGKGAVGILAKNPLVAFGAGVATGYFAHKYRKEIILSANKVTEQGKDFILRQKNSFAEMLADEGERS